jgi:hypothetical protein
LAPYLRTLPAGFAIAMYPAVSNDVPSLLGSSSLIAEMARRKHQNPRLVARVAKPAKQ